MKKKLCIATCLLLYMSGMAQELFVFTEPASNMAAKSIGLRLNNYWLTGNHTSEKNYYMTPEIMVGVSKKVMVHGDLFLNNQGKSFGANGASVYAKYRFISNDEVQRHFRVAAFGRYSFNNSIITGEEINLYGYNSGFEGGVIATQLLHKTALSAGLSLVKAMNNGSNNKYPDDKSSKALNFSLSAGTLLFPKVYKNYKQVNLNLMMELLNQLNTGSGKYYVDAAPALQLIFNSVARFDLGYRIQLSSTLLRSSVDGVFIRFEYNLFNVY